MKSFLISALAVGALAIPSNLGERQVAPVTQDLPPRYYTELGAKRTKIRYGPYKLPSSTASGPMTAMSGEKGMLTTVGVAMKKPCDDCGIVAMQAGLEYADGTPAVTETGAWLHHVVMLVNGAGKKDGTCGTGLSLWALAGERFFSSGNERTPSFFSDVVENKVKSIYPVAKGDSFAMQLELMNLNPGEQTVYYTVDYDYLPTKPAGFLSAKALRLDVTNCGISSVTPPANKNVFTLKSNPWTSTFNGQLLGTAGHLHDGGSNVKVYRNRDVVCDSKATYSKPGEANATTTTTAAHSHGGRSVIEARDGPHGDGMPHIEVMGSCQNMGPIKKGDTLSIEANYDFVTNMGMKGDRGYTPVMGIAIMFMAVDV